METSHQDVFPRASGANADPAAQIAASLRNHFQKRADLRCLLVVDPTCRPLLDRPDAGVVFSTQPKAVVPVLHNAFPQEHSPYLIELDLSAPEGGRLLVESVRVALEDRDPGRIARGQGQRVGGWLASKVSADDVAAYWSRLVLQKDDRRGTCLLRYYDSRALSLIWPVLHPAQRSVLMGPVATWHALDACGRQCSYDGGQSSRTSLDITREQWDAIGLHGPINKAIALYMHETGRQPFPAEVDAAVAAAARAARHGLSDSDDVAVFVGHALAWRPDFDAHPAVRTILSRITPDDSYTWLTGELSPEEIDEIRRGEPANGTPAGRA